MPFINLTDISPQSLGQKIETFMIKELIALFTKGEILDAVVEEKLPEQKVVLALKEQRIIADSEIPLKEGEKIAVKVDQIQPKVVLRILTQEQAESARLKETVSLKEPLLLHRSNPNALKEVIAEAGKVLTPQLQVELSRSGVKTDVEALLKRFEVLVFTKASATEPDFVKNYVAKLGLTLENSLLTLIKEQGKEQVKELIKEQIKDPQTRLPVNKNAPEAIPARDAGPIKEATDNIKGQLLKLSYEIDQILAKGDIKDTEVLKQLTRLSDFANRAVKTVEAQQVVNVVLQESDSRFVLQIPIQFQVGMRMAEVYVETERDSGRTDADGRSYRVVFFLDMDAIGSIMVDASIRSKKISCIVKCETEPVRRFAAEHLASLEERLAAQGYEIDYLSCSLEASIADERHQYVSTQNFYTDNAVHIVA
jgi:hypothetical protein